MIGSRIRRRVLAAVAGAATVGALLPVVSVQAATAPPVPVQTGPTVAWPVHQDVSAPLLPGDQQGENQGQHEDQHEAPRHPRLDGARRHSSTPGTPSSTTSLAIPSPSNSFEGVGNGFSGPAGTFSVAAAPPDPNIAVGPNHVVNTVNTDFAVFNKTGTPVYGPVPINTLWSGFGGGCQSNNDGDPVVEYDPMADRWILSQFSVSTTPYLHCIAVSQTGDPTGSYNRYSFQYTDFPDYPKMSVWPDAYYETFNMFAGGTTFNGAKMCAYDRSQMLVGGVASQQCFNTTTSFGGVLPSDLSGSRLPPAGSPNYMLSLGTGTNDLAFWKFHVDFATPANTTLTGPATITVASYAAACNGGTCIPQAGTSQRLDSLADRLMFRLQYRNFGDHEALVVNHSVSAGSSVGVRWYELRSPGTGPTVFQQGTYAPDGNYRWMGSIAIDQAGDMGLGFSVSGSSISPQIHYTGRLASDPPGTMSQGEGTLINGGGSQTGSNLSRWGDYTSMSVDPTDECTFWYTDEYIPSNGAFNWRTRIGSFKFPNCGTPPPPNDFSISVSPASGSTVQGGSVTSTVSTAITSGSAQAVALSASGQPTGATVSFNPTSITGNGSSTITVATSTSTPTGTFPITVTGTGASATHTTTFTLTVTAPVANDFSISASPTSLSVNQGGGGTSTISTALTSGSAQTITLSASGLPTGASASFNPTSVSSGGSSTMTVTTSNTTPAGSYTVTVTGTGTSATHSTSVGLAVTANDFSISVAPSSGSVTQGSSTTSTISTALVSGSAQSISLSAAGAPSLATVAFSPTSVTTGSSSTMTVTTAGSTPAGTYTITITGTAPSSSHSTTFALTVNAAVTSGITNGGFETGNLAGWTSAGATSVVSSGAHGGTYAAQVGSTSPFNGDSSIAQTFTAPSGTGTLSFWYKNVCTDTVTYDWATATLTDNTASTTTTVLAKTCTNTGAWQQVTNNVTAGHSYTLTLINHDDNYPTDPTYTLYDDVALGAAPPPPPPSPIVNGGFETGNFSGWTTSGATAVVTGGHTGTYAARVGSTSPFNGDSSISQTFTAPAGATKLSFWYRVVCTDTVTYDWAVVTLKDNTTNTTNTVLAKTCTNNGTWVQKTANLTAGHSYTVTLIDHDDNYATDPTYTLYDDVTTQ